MSEDVKQRENIKEGRWISPKTLAEDHWFTQAKPKVGVSWQPQPRGNCDVF